MPVDPGARHDGAEARERSRARRRSAAASTCSTTTARCARSTPQTLAEEARLYPAARRVPLQPARAGARRHRRHRRDVGQLDARRTRRSARCSPTTCGRTLPADAKLVLTISDDTGKQIRRLDLDKTAGLRRIAWNLRGDPPAAPAPGSPGAAAAAGRGGQGGRGGFGGGRGGNLGALVQPGRYRATLGRMAGDIVTPIGAPQSFGVLQIPQ